MEEQEEKYGKRLSHAIVAEYKKFWSGYRLLVTLSGLIAPLPLLIQRGIHSMLSVFEAVESGVVGLSLSVIGTYLYSRRKGAEFLDAGWQKKVACEEELLRQQREQITAGIEQVKRLSAEVEDLKKPRRSASMERDHQEVKSILEICSDNEKSLLQHIRRHGKIIHHHSAQISPLPFGMNQQTANTAANRLRDLSLITIEPNRTINGGWENAWKISPWAEPVLREIL